MALTFQQKFNLKKKDAAGLAGLLGRFNPADLDALAKEDSDFAETLKKARALAASMPSQEEMKAFGELESRVKTNLEDPALEADLDAYIAKWSSNTSAADHIALAQKYRQHILEARTFAALSKEVEQAIASFSSTGVTPPTQLANQLANFLATYGSQDFAAADISRARELQAQLNNVFAAQLDQEWYSLLNADGTIYDINGLANFLAKPITPARRAEADEKAWQWALSQPDIIKGAQMYNRIFNARGNHSAEVSTLQSAKYEWDRVVKTDIYSVLDYISQHPGSPFIGEANSVLEGLRGTKLDTIRRAPWNLTIEEFEEFLKSPQFKRQELFDAIGISEDTYNTVIKESVRAKKEELSQLGLGSSNMSGVGEPSITDVVLFGTTHSGKTCAISGLLLHENLRFDSKRFNGAYATYVSEHAKKGIAIDSTHGGFVATIKAEAISVDGHDYPFNLYDMAGEDFTNKITRAQTSDGRNLLTFEDMGQGAPAILNTPNDKLFFIFIDPTEKRSIQTTAINALIDLMFGKDGEESPNAEVMRRVRGLHFIVTKADTLPGPDVMESARGVLNEILNFANRDYLVRSCREYGINASKNDALDGHPYVFPFSLGQFTVGNIFLYNQYAGADTFLRVICDYCAPTKKRNWFIKTFVAPVSKPIF